MPDGRMQMKGALSNNDNTNNDTKTSHSLHGALAKSSRGFHRFGDDLLQFAFAAAKDSRHVKALD